MEYYIGDTLQISGNFYQVLGKVRYQNLSDSCCWDEYRLLNSGTGREYWLSVDNVYKEYSISEVVPRVSMDGFHLVDEGTEKVVGAWGSVDVEAGDRAQFMEYEDSTEEKIHSVEIWDDGSEYSKGYYLDAHEIHSSHGGSSANYGQTTNFQSGAMHAQTVKKAGNSIASIITIVAILSVVIGTIVPVFSGFARSKTIAEHLKETTAFYTYQTSVTGDTGEIADVYVSIQTLDATARDIIDGIDGNTESVQQNTEDGDISVAILTEKEYCLVYMAEKENEEDPDQVLVQVSSRKYAYTSDRDLYRGRRHTNRYYRRFYYSRGYTSDTTTYSGDSSPYGSFSDDPISYNSTDTYSSYSSTVRQASARRRSSSGGGLSSGK